MQECKHDNSVIIISTSVKKKKEYGVGNEIYQELLATKYIQQDKISKEKCLLKKIGNVEMDLLK